MIKTLIVEDDFTTRVMLQEILKVYGDTHIAVNGREAIDAVQAAIKAGKPYDLICLDIMIPEIDGQDVLKQIRDMEKALGVKPGKEVKVIMSTALDDAKNIIEAFKGLCDAYLVKPIDRSQLMKHIRNFKLIP